MNSTPRPRLTVDLAALKQNYRTLAAMRPGAETAAVVKANAYGLGVERVAPALIDAGCRTFFVAYTFEGAALRAAIGADATICIFNGPSADDFGAYAEHELTPVLNTPAQLALWADHGEGRPCVLHVDTGMNRLGLPVDAAAALAADEQFCAGLNVSQIITHFSCSADPGDARNPEQVASFANVAAALAKRFAQAGTSLSASGGLFLADPVDESLTRPGIALYGAGPQDRTEERLATVATLEAPVLQVRDLTRGMSVGYSATFTADQPVTIATLGIGYADGYPRSLSNKGEVYLAGTLCPVVGIVSMDLITVDITPCRNNVTPGDMAECFGRNLPVEHLAERAGTISYELFVTLGERVARHYTE